MPAKNSRVSEFADKELVYKPKYARMIGSVTAAILLKQIAFWYKLKRNQPFYKFKAPCNHKLYEEGDSWEEELGFSRSEFDCARSKIGTKITQDSGANKGDILMMDTAFFDDDGRMTNANRLIIYWTDADRVTWYILNENLLEDALSKLDLKRESGFSRKRGNPALAGKAAIQHYPITEKTPEITTETTFHVEKSNNDFPRAATIETPQQSLFDNLSETTTDGYTVVESKQPVLSKERAPKKPDALFDAIAEVWQSAPGMTGKIKQQLTGKIPEKKPDYVTNFDRPATPEEVRAFAGWYAKACRGCPMPLARDKIQHHFYAFRRAQTAQVRKATPKTREANGRLLEYNSDSMKWYDIGPAPLSHQPREAYVS